MGYTSKEDRLLVGPTNGIYICTTKQDSFIYTHILEGAVSQGNRELIRDSLAHVFLYFNHSLQYKMLLNIYCIHPHLANKVRRNINIYMCVCVYFFSCQGIVLYEKILLDVAITDEPTHTHRAKNVCARGTRDRRQDRTVSFGIRTVNPAFYSPGIEVYSVLTSNARECVRPYMCA